MQPVDFLYALTKSKSNSMTVCMKKKKKKENSNFSRILLISFVLLSKDTNPRPHSNRNFRNLQSSTISELLFYAVFISQDDACDMFFSFILGER